MPTDSGDAFFLRLTSGVESERNAALEELRVFLRGALARSFRAKLSDGDLDDLAQESVLRVHQQLASFEHKSRVTTWAAAIAVNRALSELRRRRHRHVSLDDAVELADAALVAESDAGLCELEAAIAQLRRGIAEALTARQRDATLAVLGGLPLMEIARRLETSQGAVYKLLHDARQRLKRYLERAERAPELYPSAAGST